MVEGDGGQFLGNRALEFAKLLEHVTIIHMHLPLKQLGKWMHGFQVMGKTNFCSMYFVSYSKT